MYNRFLNNADYMSQISDELFDQLIRGQQIRVEQAEEAAEASIVAYLTDNYEVEKALEVGKNLRDYNPHITYPVGVHFYHEGKIVETLRSINGIKSPALVEYWEACEDLDRNSKDNITNYSQLLNYHPGDLVHFSGVVYECLEHNGFDYGDIRIPGISAWEQIETTPWEPNMEFYELHKLISPNNVSSARITDYEATMQWLHDANRCKINPQIPRKLDEEKKPVSKIAMATFQRDYDPRKNPWQI